MQVKRLALTNVRAFQQAELEFQPAGINLLVGVNGAGKSTVLDVLRIMLSQSLGKFTVARIGKMGFSKNDIMFAQEALTITLDFEVRNTRFTHKIVEQREDFKIREDREGQVRDQTFNLPEPNVLTPKSIPRNVKNGSDQPLVLYFSTRRSLASLKKPTKTSSAGGQAAAYTDALTNRELRLREFAEWWLVQDTLAHETSENIYQQRLVTLEKAVTSFLGEEYARLRGVKEPQTTLMLDKNGQSFDVRYLSDGERSMLALVADLARRLSLANPQLANPLQQGEALVLIDEIDLHLHPSWQRTICERLMNVFPKCQFIATTHSPQIIGEVSPENIILIEHGQISRPPQSFGMDTNWILRNLMDTKDRDPGTDKRFDEIEATIASSEYDEALEAIYALRNTLRGYDEELLGLEARIESLRFFDDDENYNLDDEDSLTDDTDVE